MYLKPNLLAALLMAGTPLSAQTPDALERSLRNIQYMAEAQGTVSDNRAPLWLTANRYGLSSIEAPNGLLRVQMTSNAERDSLANWRIGYGADIAAALNFTSNVVIQQLYADIDYKLVRLTLGAKEEPMAFKNRLLSSGGQTFGINARPVPQVRIELPQYWNISGKGKWAAIRGFISYGIMTDGRFQSGYVSPNQTYARKALLHSKAGYLKLGNEEKFPLTFEGGLEMATVFGGTVYNALTWEGVQASPIHMSSGIKDFINATLGIGGDVTDGEGYSNATGNTLGSWLFRLNYKGKGWSAGIYYDHFFEDHSQMFLDYGWYDGLAGLEVNLPANRFVSTVVYEFLNTTYQSGPVYHDRTETIPDQISGVDNYYNHNLYPGWQHWGNAIGNPLFISPLYNDNGSLTFTGNRFKAHHVGIVGLPIPHLAYRILYTYERSLGTYAVPFENARTTHSMLAEFEYSPRKIGDWELDGWHVKLAFAMDRGKLLGNNTGFQLGISKTGVFSR